MRLHDVVESVHFVDSRVKVVVSELALQRLGNMSGERLSKPFSELHDDVTHEAVTNNYFSLTCRQVIAFHIADEFQAALLQKFGSLAHLSIALAGFFTHTEQGDTGLLDAPKLPSEHVTNYGEAQHLRWSAVNIGAEVNNERIGRDPDHRSTQRRTVNAFR